MFDFCFASTKIFLYLSQAKIQIIYLRFTEGVVSYSGPQGDVFRNNDLIDETYDGIVENGFLKGKNN